MGVIAVYCRNGGTGKTTLAVNLGWASARILKHRTLLWDLDPLAVATFYLSSPADTKPRFGAALAFDVGITQFIRPTSIRNLDLLPGDVSLRALNTLSAGADRGGRFRKLIEEALRTYNRIILDCPPGFASLADHAMMNADVVAVPVTLSAVSMKALTDLQRDLQDQSGNGATLMPIHTMVDRKRASHRTFLERNPQFPVIPITDAVEAINDSKAIVGSIAPRSDAARSYVAISRIIEVTLRERKERPQETASQVTSTLIGG